MMMGEFVGFAFVMIILLAAYWSFVILPRQRLYRKHNQYVRTLSVGDEVITAGGIVGTIARMDSDEGIAHVAVSEGVVIRVLTAALSRPFDAQEVAHNAGLGVEPVASAAAMDARVNPVSPVNPANQTDETDQTVDQKAQQPS